MKEAEIPENIYPEFARMLGRSEKESLLKQRGTVVWFYGLSGSGKSTLANAFERRLHGRGVLTQILDGDNIRSGLNRNLGFSDEDRAENIRRIAEVAKLFLNAGVLTLASFITPTRELRDLARRIVGEEDFLEVYVRASFETCAQRDVKGLYAKAASGKVANFTGKDSGFEEPENPDLLLDTESHPIEDCLESLEAVLVAQNKLVSVG
ncbi:MAG: adenylyl-sulfate kinase [Puniceicoccaceae bacterium]